MIVGHGGNFREVARQIGCRPSEVIDMSSNVNPLGPPPGLLAHLTRHLEAILTLPEVDSRQWWKPLHGATACPPTPSWPATAPPS